MAFVQSATYTGLQTYTVNIPTTDLYNFEGTLTVPTAVPTAAQGPGGGAGTGSAVASISPSQVVVTVKQNGTTIYTGQAGALGFGLLAVSCSAGDVITFVLSSSLASDSAMLNSVKMTLSVSEGAF
ncbi:unnamed protein product [Sphagnum balticum]